MIFFTKLYNYYKTIYFNLHYLPLHIAIKFPIKLVSSVKAINLKRGQIVLDNWNKNNCYHILLGGVKVQHFNLIQESRFEWQIMQNYFSKELLL